MAILVGIFLRRKLDQGSVGSSWRGLKLHSLLFAWMSTRVRPCWDIHTKILHQDYIVKYLGKSNNANNNAPYIYRRNRRTIFHHISCTREAVLSVVTVQHSQCLRGQTKWGASCLKDTTSLSIQRKQAGMDGWLLICVAPSMYLMLHRRPVHCLSFTTTLWNRLG